MKNEDNEVEKASEERNDLNESPNLIDYKERETKVFTSEQHPKYIYVLITRIQEQLNQIYSEKR